MDIVKAIEEENIFRPLFRDLKTWQSWLTFLKGLFALPMDKDELRLFRKCTGLKTGSTEPAREAFVVAGRRSGKSFISSIIAVFLALFHDWKPYLSPGEKGWIFIIATDRNQAKIIKNYVSAILSSSPLFRKMVKKERADEIELVNDIVIAVKTCDFRSVRGYTVVAAICEELAFWRSEDSANPAQEVLTALRPALSTIPSSLLLGISTPYSRSGLLWQMFRERGKRGAPLVWQAETQTMNPTISKKLIDDALREDYSAAQAEWLAQFRADISSFLSLELIEQAVISNRFELPKVEGISYHAFCDPSGGRQDSMTLAVAHKDSVTNKTVLDVLRESKPPFRPETVTEEFSQVLKEYEVSQIQSDRYAGEWVTSAFQNHSIMVEPSELTASELYLALLPLLSNGSVELLDSDKLASQLRSLERRTRSGGRDQVTHSPGAHDDLANACAGAVVMAEKTETFRIMPSRGFMEPEHREGMISERDRNILYTEDERKRAREEAREENKLLHRIEYVDDDGDPISEKEFMRLVREKGKEKA